MPDSIIPIRLDLTIAELADLLTALADWSIEGSRKERDDDDIPRPDLDGATPREVRIGDLYQRFGAILPESAQGLADPAAGQRVVADVGNASVARARCRQTSSGGRAPRARHPRVDAVRDHVVESAGRCVKSSIVPNSRVTLVNRSASTRAGPRSIAVAERSSPTKLAPGSATAIGMRLPPSPQPSSSTRQLSTAGGASPNSVPTVASRSGCVCAYGCPGVRDDVVGGGGQSLLLFVTSHPALEVERAEERAVGLLLLVLDLDPAEAQRHRVTRRLGVRRRRRSGSRARARRRARTSGSRRAAWSPPCARSARRS